MIILSFYRKIEETEDVIDEPFKIFAPFADRFIVKFFVKEDNIKTDADVARILGSDNIASLHQEHKNKTLTVREKTSRTELADGLATDVPDLWLTTRAADCQSFVIYAPKQHIAAVLHSGWKGLKAGAILELFATLKREWSIDPSDVSVGIGPSICETCAEFTDPATELAGLDPQFFHGRHADLRGIADAQLDAVGVPKTRRERNPDCTKCRSDMYWSYRGGDLDAVKKGYTDVLACALR